MVDIKEIVEEIAKEIKKANPSATISKTLIRDTVDGLRKARLPKFKYRKDNTKYLSDILKWIENGERLLAGRPNALNPAVLFFGAKTEQEFLAECQRWRWRDKPPTFIDFHEKTKDEPLPPDLYKEIKTVAEWLQRGFKRKVLHDVGHMVFPQVVIERMELLRGLLDDMRQHCGFILNGKVGAHGSSGHEQERAANTALVLIRLFDVEPAPTSEKSTFRTIARLLYEAMTGQPDVDIERACRKAVKDQARDAKLLRERRK
jgi:hypothetical protein